MRSKGEAGRGHCTDLTVTSHTERRPIQAHTGPYRAPPYHWLRYLCTMTWGKRFFFFFGKGGIGSSEDRTNYCAVCSELSIKMSRVEKSITVEMSWQFPHHMLCQAPDPSFPQENSGIHTRHKKINKDNIGYITVEWSEAHCKFDLFNIFTFPHVVTT